MTNPIDELIAAADMAADEWGRAGAAFEPHDSRRARCREERDRLHAAVDRVRAWRAREMGDEELVTLYASAASGMRHLAGLRAVERAVRERSGT